MHKSSITSSIKTKILFRGIILSFLGFTPLLFFGIYANTHLLKSYGLITFLFAMASISLGFVPYKKLGKLELYPYELEITDEILTLFKNKKAILSILLSEIRNIEYIKSIFFHGIGIVVDTPHINLSRLQLARKWKMRKSYDIILPYFSEKAFLELKQRVVKG